VVGGDEHFVPVARRRRRASLATGHVIVVTEVWRSIAGKHPATDPEQWDEPMVTVATTFNLARYVRYANARARATFCASRSITALADQIKIL